MTQTSEPRTLKIRDAGPIRSLDVTLPEGGGIVVISGRNGSGKTTAINALARTLGGTEAVSKRDRAIAGSVELDNIKLTLGKQVRATGESSLVALSLQGGEMLRRFVDPGLKDPVAADASRVKDGLGLMRAMARPEDFVQAVGGPQAMAAITTEADLKTADPVDLAGRVKRGAELQARRHESEADRLSGEIDARVKANEGMDLNIPHDEAALAAAHEAAVRDLATLETTARERTAALARAATARVELDRQAAGMSLADAEAAVLTRRQALAETDGTIERLNAELALAREQRAGQTKAVQDAEGQLATVKQREAALAGWRQSVAAGDGVEPISDTELLRLRAAVEGARADMARGAAVRAAQKRDTEISILRSQRDAATEQAEVFRKAAAAAEGVLSGLFAATGCGLQVRDGRLVTEVPDRGEVYFHELSHGQKYRFGIGLATAGCGPGGLIPLDQVGYEGLDPANRLEVLEEARARGVTIITAEATDGDLRATEFTGDEAAA